MMFFLVALTVFGSAYAFVGLRLAGPHGPLGVGMVWGVLLIHLVATFVSFAVLRQVGPNPTTTPLFWFVYVGMGLFSFVFTGLLVAELGLLSFRFVGGVDESRRLFIRGALNWGVLAAAGVAGAWGIRNARRRPTVVEVDVPIDDLHPALEGYRIAQVSDLHVGPTIGADFAQTVVDAVNGLAPDMVALTGDLVDGSVEHLSEGVAPLGSLKATDGVFFVTGNHEYYSGVRTWCEKMAELGANVLLNQHRMIERGDGKLLIAGVTDLSAGRMIPSHASDPAVALAGAPDHDVRILLAHQPNSCRAAEAHGFDLQLSGHTHGGQMFPWNLFVGLAHVFDRGLHRFGRGWVYVNTGTGYWGPPMRVGVQSEITLLRLVRSA
jgi:hypothetical protein